MIGAIIFLVLLGATIAAIVIGVQKSKAEKAQAEELIIDKPVAEPAPDPIVEVKPAKTKTAAPKKTATKKTKK